MEFSNEKPRKKTKAMKVNERKKRSRAKKRAQGANTAASSGCQAHQSSVTGYSQCQPPKKVQFCKDSNYAGRVDGSAKQKSQSIKKSEATNAFTKNQKMIPIAESQGNGGTITPTLVDTYVAMQNFSNEFCRRKGCSTLENQEKLNNFKKFMRYTQLSGSKGSYDEFFSFQDFSDQYLARVTEGNFCYDDESTWQAFRDFQHVMCDLMELGVPIEATKKTSTAESEAAQAFAGNNCMSSEQLPSNLEPSNTIACQHIVAVRVEQEGQLLQQQRAVTKLQSFVRMHHAKCDFKRAKAGLLSFQNLVRIRHSNMSMAATKLQCYARMYRARCNFNKGKGGFVSLQKIVRTHQSRSRAAIKLQSTVRMYLATSTFTVTRSSISSHEVTNNGSLVSKDAPNKDASDGVPLRKSARLNAVKGGDFEQPDLQPGEFKCLKLKGDSQDFSSKVVEIGIPGRCLDIGMKYYHEQKIAREMDGLVGKNRKKVCQGFEKQISTGWTIKKDVKTNTSDVTYAYPSTDEKIEEALYSMDELGQVGTIVNAAARFLGEDKLAVLDCNFIAVSHNQCRITNRHQDMKGGFIAGTLLIPLKLPAGERGELWIDGESASAEDSNPTGEYKYRTEAALFFECGVYHNTNTWGDPDDGEPRIMLCLHLGRFTKHEIETGDGFRFRDETFRLPPAKRLKNSVIAAMRWQADYLITFDEKTKKLTFPGRGKGKVEELPVLRRKSSRRKRRKASLDVTADKDNKRYKWYHDGC